MKRRKANCGEKGGIITWISNFKGIGCRSREKKDRSKKRGVAKKDEGQLGKGKRRGGDLL